ncbi:MAG: hypothetical protein JM58_00740 [Peptococcaceae bacterium BICA1-8]|nr:MAG: hypothetical protein JM58_00740 [Peptococcaceae bacterium BICA1-8]
MVEDFLSYLILVCDNTYEIMKPLWVFLFIGSLLSVIVERLKIFNTCPANPFLGSLLGIISPIPTINLTKIIKPGKNAGAFFFSSLLATPILLIIIYLNLGLEAMISYVILIYIIGVCCGFLIPCKEDVLFESINVKKYRNIFDQCWGHFSYIGFYTLVGGLIVAIMRTFIAYTFYNVNIISYLPSMIKTGFVLLSAPLYSCGGTWMPVLGELKDLGLGLGAVLGFIVFGQATRFGHLMALESIFSKKHIGYFVSVLGVISIGIGYLL